MNGSKEELLEMTEITSQVKKALNKQKNPKKRNKVHSPPFVSPSHSVDKDVTSLFSVKKSSQYSSIVDDSETISEVSDDILTEQNISKSDDVPTSGKSRSRQSHKINKLKLSLEKLRRESSEIDATIKSVRSKFSLDDDKSVKPEFYFFSSIKKETEEHILKEDVEEDEYETYHYAENLNFNMDLAEKECLFIPTNKALCIESKLVEEQPRHLEEEGLYVGPKLNTARNHVNVLERRLLANDDKKWFNCEGNLTIVPDPVIDRCVKPVVVITPGEGTVYDPPHRDEDMDEVLIVKEKILELSFTNLKFSHHPLFSLEHVFQEKLRETFAKYSYSVENCTLQKLKNQLEALKHAMKLNKSNEYDDEALTKIKTLRENLFQEGKQQRDRLKSILAIWKGLKNLREKQKYSNTSVKLVIKKQKKDVSEERASYKKFFSDTLLDVLEEHRSAYKKKLKEYSQKIEAKKDAISNSRSDSDVEDEDDDDVPEEPFYDVDENEIEHELKEKFKQSFKPPGEPDLQLVLLHDNEITQDIDDEREIARRKIVSSTKIAFKILCNGILVCKSKPVGLDDNFTLEIDDFFSIQLTDVPKHLDLVITEHPKGLLKKKICEMNVDLPKENAFYRNAKISEIGFEKKEIVHYKHAGVGSGSAIEKIMEEAGVKAEVKMDTTKEMNTAGAVSIRIGWQKDLSVTSDNSNDNSGLPILNVIDKWGAVDEQQLEIWLEGRPPDPQDPRNSAFFEYLESNISDDGEQRWGRKNRDFFRLSPYAKEMIFCKTDDLDQNIRLQYLKLRDQNEYEFDGVAIPNRVREIPLELLRDYKKRKALEAIQDDDSDADLDTLRNAGGRHLKQIHRKIFQMCKGETNNLSYESLVDEKYLIYLE